MLVAFYIPSMPAEQVARHGIDQAECSRSSTRSPAATCQGDRDVQPGDGREAVRGRHPRGVAEQIRRDILPAGINHIILALADAPLVQFFSGRTIEGVPPITTQLRMVAERMIPAFA